MRNYGARKIFWHKIMKAHIRLDLKGWRINRSEDAVTLKSTSRTFKKYALIADNYCLKTIATCRPRFLPTSKTPATNTSPFETTMMVRDDS
jgi:hypothetical protein